MHLVQVIILQGIVLFQSLKFYDDEIPCKHANLLDTDLLVLDVIDDFEKWLFRAGSSFGYSVHLITND